MVNLSLEEIKSQLSNVIDVKYRVIKCNNETITLVFVDNMCDPKYVNEYIITPLLNYDKPVKDIATISQEVIMAGPGAEVTRVKDAINHILSGDVLLFFDFLDEVIYIQAKGYAKRSIAIPPTESVIKGSREGLNESIHDNLSSIRRRLKTPDLKVEAFKLGKKSQTDAVMIYIDGSAPVELITYVRDKINEIKDIDYCMNCNAIEEVMKCKGTPFDTIGYSEKPDTIAQKVTEGRVAVVVDGTAFSIIAPYFFIENFHTTDDYTLNKFMATTGRLLRFLSFGISTLVPGLFLALVTHHFKLIPSIFLFKMAIFRAGVPLPTVIELMVMTMFFQIIREAGVRLPQPIGPTLSIVGALILGEAAVNSGLASQITVVVVGITSICSYLVPAMYISIFFWNTVLVVFAAILGLPGFYMGFILLVAHLANLTTCGYPYLFPLGTRETYKFKDTFFRGDIVKISKNLLQRDDE